MIATSALHQALILYTLSLGGLNSTAKSILEEAAGPLIKGPSAVPQKQIVHSRITRHTPNPDMTACGKSSRHRHSTQLLTCANMHSCLKNLLPFGMSTNQISGADALLLTSCTTLCNAAAEAQPQHCCDHRVTDC